MCRIIFTAIPLATIMALAAAAGHSADKSDKDTSGDNKVPAVLDFKMKRLNGKEQDLAAYKGKVVLIVNTASECGYTPQYKGLQALHEKYAEKGLAVIGFPANEFGKQEPGSDTQIAKFCKDNFGVTFDMYSKVVVKGEGQCPLYKYLTSDKTNPKFAGDVKWNFEKFLVGRDGKVAGRFPSAIEPESEELVEAIEIALEGK